MFRRQALRVLLAAPLAIAGCGGSSHSSGTSTSSTTSVASAGATGSSATTSRSATAGSGGASRSSGAGSSGSTGASGANSGGGGGAINARVPATYHLGSGGHLTPPTISVPAFIAVEITIASSDSAPHTVQVRTPVPHTLRVSGHGRAAVRIPGLRAGTYPVAVDGATRGALSIGGEPGP